MGPTGFEPVTSSILSLADTSTRRYAAKLRARISEKRKKAVYKTISVEQVAPVTV